MINLSPHVRSWPVLLGLLRKWVVSFMWEGKYSRLLCERESIVIDFNLLLMINVKDSSVLTLLWRPCRYVCDHQSTLPRRDWKWKICDISIISIGEYTNWAFWLVEKLIMWRYIHPARTWLVSSLSLPFQQVNIADSCWMFSFIRKT